MGDQWALPKYKPNKRRGTLEKGNGNVLIGIIDSGISIDGGNLSHSDLDDGTRYILGTDFIDDDASPDDQFGHGTHVTGTAAAETDNASGIAGMNWNSKVYVCRQSDEFGNGSASDFQAAVEEIVDFAVANNMKAVINQRRRPRQPDEVDACQYILDNGMLLWLRPEMMTWHGDRSPALHSADFNCVIAVGATDDNDEVADFSNVGPEVTVVAPGVDILSTFPTYDVNGDTAHDFVNWDGTQMATPHVTGLASLVWSREGRLTE